VRRRSLRHVEATKPILYCEPFLVLLALTFLLNFSAIMIRARIRKRLRYGANPIMAREAPAFRRWHSTEKPVDLRVRAAEVEILKGSAWKYGVAKSSRLSGGRCGKTTFLRCLNRWPNWTSMSKCRGNPAGDGKSIIRQRRSDAPPPDRDGIFGSIPLPMTVYENWLRSPSRFGKHGSYDDARGEGARAAYLWDEMKDRLDEPARNLSGGQQQRLCLARTLVLQPRVVAAG